MIELRSLSEYNLEHAMHIRQLLIQLSRNGRDAGEIPETWFNDIVNSPYHDLIVALDNNQIVGMATVSITMGPGIRRVAYLNDFIVDEKYRGSGVSDSIWDAVVEWAKERKCNRLEFTCGEGRDAAQKFYKKHGAEIYNTNFFRKEINE